MTLRIVRTVLAALVLTGCNNGPQYTWYSVGQKLGFAYGFAFGPDAVPSIFDTELGLVRYDSSSNLWRSRKVPGGLGAGYVVGADGTEYVSSNGIYRRAPGADAFDLIPGSRALQLTLVGADREGTRYALEPTADQNKPRLLGLLKDSTEWQLVSPQPSGAVGFTLTTKGQAFLSGGGEDTRLTGLVATTLAGGLAFFDADDNRYTFEVGQKIWQLSDTGERSLWADLSESPRPSIQQPIGFGRDGRFYAIAGFTAGQRGLDFESFDIIALSREAPKWTKVASTVSDASGLNVAGLPLPIDSYSPVFAPDGSLYFLGCESGCSGRNNFSLGVYQLAIGGR